jgi:hypothetical protein
MKIRNKKITFKVIHLWCRTAVIQVTQGVVCILGFITIYSTLKWMRLTFVPKIN